MKNQLKTQQLKERQSYRWYMLSLVLMLMTGLAILVTVFLAFYPFKTTDYLNDPFPTNQKVYKQGDTISFKVQYCKYKPYTLTVVRELVSSTTVTTLPTLESNFPIGCPVTLNVARTTIPLHLPDGMYKLVLVANIRVNPLQTQTKVIETQPFEVQGGDSVGN